MKLVLDQGLPRSACAILRDLGHEVVHVGDIGMAQAIDMAPTGRMSQFAR